MKKNYEQPDIDVIILGVIDSVMGLSDGDIDTGDDAEDWG